MFLPFLLVGFVTFAAPDAPAKATHPATVEEATAVLDLSTFPLLSPAEEHKARRIAGLFYESKAKVAEAYAFQKKTLTRLGWTVSAGEHVSEQSASGTFEKGGYRVSVAAFPSAKGSMISLNGHGNIEPKAMPIPPTTKLLFAGPTSAMFVTEKTVEEATASCTKALEALGWKPYGTAGDQHFFKQNAVRLSLNVMKAPAQGDKTVITYSSELMSADLPAPADTLRTHYADVTKEVSFDTKQDAPAIVAFYRESLGKLGWKPTTESTIKDRAEESLYFLNPRKDLLTLSMRTVDDLLRVQLRHHSAAEVAEETRLAEEEAKKRNRPAPPKPVVSISLPAGAKEVEAKPTQIEFKLASGTAKAAVQALASALKKDGWKEDVASLDNLAGAVSLSKGRGDLTINYVDAGIGAAEVSISAIGVTLEKAK